MKSTSFRYARPESPEEAVSVLSELGDAAKVLAGGQSLLAMMNLRLAQPEVLVDIGACGLSGVTEDGGLEIGAMTTQNADPAAELPAVLMALGGEVVALGPSGPRTVGADDLFVSAYTTALEDEEVLTTVRLPTRPPDAWAFTELARRHGDFAIAGVAAAFDLSPDGEITSGRLALFGVDERPIGVPERAPSC